MVRSRSCVNTCLGVSVIIKKKTICSRCLIFSDNLNKTKILLHRLHATPGPDSIAHLVPQVQTLEGTHHQTSGQVTMLFTIEKLYMYMYLGKARTYYTIK
jgi:hypothetical protein